VRHWTGTTLHSHFKSTAGCIPARLECQFVGKDAESSVKGLLPLVQMFATRLIWQTTGMEIVDERQQHPMQPLHDGSCSRKRRFGVGNTFIVPISAIQGAVHRLPLTPQPERSQWYLSNTIDLNGFNLYLLLSIRRKVIVAAIYRYPMNVYSGCPNFRNGSCASLCIINVSRD